MNYNKIYKDIVNYAQIKNRSDVYTETHHIIPRCVGGTNLKENLVELTPREHFVCHMLLTKIYPSSLKLKSAAWVLLHFTKDRTGNTLYRGNSKKYETYRTMLFEPKITKCCLMCKKEITAWKSTKDIKKFCSRKCAWKNRQNRITKKCKICNKEFVVIRARAKASICGSKCRTRNIHKIGIQTKKREPKKCKNPICCNLIYGKPSFIKSREFCSRLCSARRFKRQS